MRPRRKGTGLAQSPYRQSSPSHQRNGHSPKASSPFGSGRLASMLAQYVPSTGYGAPPSPYSHQPLQQFVFPEAVKIRDGLFLANTEAVQDIGFVLANKIDHVVSCDRASPVPHQLAKFGVTYSTFSWLDIYLEFSLTPDRREGKRIFQLFYVMEDALDQGHGIILHSLHDFTRASCCLMAWIMWRYEWPLDKALRLMQYKKPDLQLDSAHIQQLNNLHKIFSHTPRPRRSIDDDEFRKEERTFSNTLDNYIHAEKPFIPDDEENEFAVSGTTRLRWADIDGRGEVLVRPPGPGYNDRIAMRNERTVTPIIKQAQSGDERTSHERNGAMHSTTSAMSSDSSDDDAKPKGFIDGSNDKSSNEEHSTRATAKRPGSGSRPGAAAQLGRPTVSGRPASASGTTAQRAIKRDVLPDIINIDSSNTNSSHIPGSPAIPRDLLVRAGLEDDGIDSSEKEKDGDAVGDAALFHRRRPSSGGSSSARFSNALRGQVEHARQAAESQSIDGEDDNIEDSESRPATSSHATSRSLDALDRTYPPRSASIATRAGSAKPRRKDRSALSSSGPVTLAGNSEKSYMRRTASSIASMSPGAQALNGSTGTNWGKQTSLGAYRTTSGRKSQSGRPGSSRPQRSTVMPPANPTSPNRRSPSRELAARDPSMSLFASPATLNSRKGGFVADRPHITMSQTRTLSQSMRRSTQ